MFVLFFILFLDKLLGALQRSLIDGVGKSEHEDADGRQPLLAVDDDPFPRSIGLAHDCAEENIRRNNLTTRLHSICTDLRELPVEFHGRMHCCVSNPPYFSGGPASKATPTARRDDTCTPEDLFRTAGKALRYGGDFFLVHKPEKLAQLITCGAANGMEAKNLTLLRHKEGGPIALILLQLRKGGKPGLQIHEQCLFDSQGGETAYYREVYHI